MRPTLIMSSNMASLIHTFSAAWRQRHAQVKSLLLLVLLLVGSSAQAEFYKFQLNVTMDGPFNLNPNETMDLSNFADITGGTAEIVNPQNSTSNIIDTKSSIYHITLRGTYVHIHLNSALQAGEVISFESYNQNCDLYITNSNETSTSSIVLAASTIAGKDANNITYYSGSYTVADNDGIQGKTDIYLWNKARAYIRNFSIQGLSYNYTLNAVDGNNNVLKTIATGEVGDQNVTVYYPIIIEKDGKFYKCSDTSDYSVTFDAADGSDTTVKTVTYTENSNIVAYIEGEDAANYNNGVSDAAYSNGSTGHVKPDSPTQVATSLDPGKYTYYAYLTANGGRSLDLRNGNNNDNKSNWVASLGINKNSAAGSYNNTFTIHSTMPIKLSGWTHDNDGTTNQSADFDYLYIVKDNDHVTTLTSISVKDNTTIAKEATETLTVTYTPSVTTTPIVRWYSSDPSVASVNAETGVVTGVDYGDAVITAYVDGGAITATCNVKVSDSKTTNDLTAIDTDWHYEPSQALTDGVLYDSGRLLSIGGNGFDIGGLQVKNNRKIALKLNANAALKVTYKSKSTDARTAQIGTTETGKEIAEKSVAAKGAETITCYPNAGVLFLNASKDLYVTDIQVIYSTCKVTFNVGSYGTCSTTELTETKPAIGVTLPSVTPNNGYSFLGWATSSTATTPDVDETEATYYPASNITLYAVYQKQDALKSVVVNGHTLVVSEKSSGASEDDTYTYSIGNAWGQSTISVTITPVSTAKATVTINGTTTTSNNNGDAIIVNVPINGESQEISVTNGTSTSIYYIKINEAANISFSGDGYAIANQTYYEGQIITSANIITAWISPTAGGNDLNSANSTNGELKANPNSYSGDISYSYQLYNSNGNNAQWDDDTFAPTFGTYYAFQPTVSGTLEVAVQIGANKVLYVSDGTKRLTNGDGFSTSDIILNASGATTASSTGSIYINVEAGKTYYVYGGNTKLGLLGFALNAGWLHVVEDGQEYILSTDNYNAHSYFTKTNAGNTTTHKSVTIYRIKSTTDKVSVNVKDATAVQAVIYNNGSNRNFTIAVDGTIQGTETAAKGETTSSYYAINKNGATVTLAGTDHDLYAYKLIFYRNTPSIIDVKKNNEKITTDTLYVDDSQTSYTITTNNSSGAVSMNASAVSSFATATLTESNGSYTLNVTPVGSGKTGSGIITISQDASGDYSSGETQFILAVRKHGLTLTLTHNSNDHYTYNADNSTPQDGSFYAATSHTTYTNGSTSTAWTITAKNDKDGDVSGLTGYKYYSDDQSVATVALNGGAVTMAANPFGTTNIIVLYEGDDNYEAAKAEFPIKVTSGIDVKISKGDKPDLNKKYAALSTNGDTLCTMIAGGYKYNKGEIFGSTDNWGTAGPYDDASKFTCQLDGFINQSQADVDSRNEFNQEIEWYEEYASTDTKHENPLMRRIKPFTLPVRGAYLKFEPTVNGILTAYVLQNGDITFENQGGDGLPYEIGKAPRAYYWFDQNGYRIEPTHYVSKLPLHYGRDYSKDGGVTKVFYDNGKKDHNLNDWYNSHSGLQDLYENSTVNEETGEVTKEAKWPTQAQVNANLARVIPDPQPVVRYANGFSVHQKAYVKYQLNVVAGNTYYFFSNVSKVGFAGFNFKQNDNAVPTAYNEDGAQYNITVTRKTSSQAMKQSGDDADVLTTFKPQSAVYVNQYDEITFSRTFKVDTWNTITLPFPLTETQVEKVFGVGTILVTYNGVAQSGGHNTAFFLRHVDQNILAGQPYFIKPTGVKSKTKDNNDNVVITYIDNVTTGDATPKYVGGNGGLTFKGVNVSFNLAAQNYEQDTYKESGSCAYKDTDLRCVGTLAKTNVATGDYFINVNSGDLVEYTGTGTQMNAYRAFLKQTGTNQVKLTSVNYSGLDGVDWEAEATGIMEVLVNDMGVEIAPVQGVYNLNGQKVGDSTKGLPAGLYIVNGKVINIK